MKKFFTIFALTFSAFAAFADINAAAFKKISDADKPWCYWLCLNGNIDRETITKDLETMKAMGFGGYLYAEPRGYWEDEDHLIYPKPTCDFLDAKWRENFKFAIQESARLGLKASINISSCGGSLKGPWRLGADAPKRLICKITPLTAGENPNLNISNPALKYFWKVGVFAVKYSGGKIGNASGWLNAGDGIYSMAASRGVRTDKNSLENRDALEVVNLDGADAAKWRAPSDGNWALITFAYTTMDGFEYDVDILDPAAVERHYHRIADAFKADLGSLMGTTLTHFYNVSWEGTVPTWTTDLEKYFKKFCGYDISEMMPVLAGFNVGGKKKSDAFMTDFRRARNECFLQNFYAKMVELSHADGIVWHAESGGIWKRNPQTFGEADQMAFLGVNDMPQGEFWNNSPKEKNLIKPIANAAHIYGKNLAAVESFTHMTYHWSMYPAFLKPFADKTFIDGGNFVLWHTFTASPKKFGKPGVDYFAGTHINGNVTWHKQVTPFLEYIARCQHMLRLGKPAVDFAVYMGDMSYQHWGRWADKPFASSSLKFPKGCTYDIVNNDVLENFASVETGALKLKGGMRYRALIIDLENPFVSPKALEKIRELQKAGLSVIVAGKKPQGAAGLNDDGAKSVELGAAIWQSAETFPEYLKNSKCVSDFDGPFESIHRKLKDTDIYFVAGSGKGTQIFRASGEAELWNPLDGSVKRAKAEKLSDGRTAIDIDLPENGGIFVVFKKKSELALETEKPVVKVLPIEGAWSVKFQSGRGAPAGVEMKTLTAWNESDNEGIRHFSGEAVYSKTFTLDALPKNGAEISLGKVWVVADVYLNGKFCGTVWTAPWKADIGAALKVGENHLEIRVINTWVNRLIGDAALPEEKRITQSNMRLKDGKRGKETPYSGFCSQDPLQPSGLLGPVSIELK